MKTTSNKKQPKATGHAQKGKTMHHQDLPKQGSRPVHDHDNRISPSGHVAGSSYLRGLPDSHENLYRARRENL